MVNKRISLKLKSSKTLEAVILIALWLIILAIPIFTTYNRNGSVFWTPVTQFWRLMVPYILLTLLNHFVLVPYLLFKNKARYFLALLLTFILFVFLLKTIRTNDLKRHNLPTPNAQTEKAEPLPQRQRPFPQNGMPPLPGQNQMRPMPQPFRNSLPPYILSALIALLVIGFDTGMRSLFQWSRTEREKAIVEKENIKTELAFLRNQISPHFFMNTLNNIHALIDVDTEEAKDALIRLSNLMRHLLYESNQDLIPIEKEITFIQSYVSLMKLRYNEKVEILLDLENIRNEVKIPPLLFTSLIENAFKYGVSYKTKSFIHILLSTRKNELNFAVKNSIVYQHSVVEEEKRHSGIGLENTRKRLDLLYKDHYSMEVNNENNIFTVHLKLPL